MPDSTESTAVATKMGRPYIDIVKLFATLNHPTRWRMVEVLAGGRAMSGTDMAGMFRCELGVALKHLQRLRKTGLLESRTHSTDTRVTLYYMPEVWRAQPGVLEFGSCRIRLKRDDDQLSVSQT